MSASTSQLAPTSEERIAAELGRIARIVIGLDAQHEYLTRGFVRIDDLWSNDLSHAIAAEARAGYDVAELPEARPGPNTAESGNRSPARQTTLSMSPLLAALHEALTRVARVVSAKMVVPTVGTYGYYEKDDGCYLHLDTHAADVTFLIMALGHLGPLHMHPELEGSSVQLLHELENDPTWDRESGVPISYPRTGVAAIRGRVLPHHRPKSPINGVNAVAAIHYRVLF